MKKAILGVLCIVSLFFAVFAVWAEGPVLIQKNSPPNSDNFEILVKQKQPNSKSVVPEGSIHNFVLSPVIDDNKNRICVSVDNNIKIDAPAEGLDLFVLYYYQTREKSSIGWSEWGEWKKYFTGDIWHWSQEDSINYYLRLHWYFLEEFGTIPPSQGRFKIEMYDASGTLLDTATTKDRLYWYPILIESEMYDDLGYLP